MLICVFRHSPKTPFSPLQKHRKYRCFDSILGLREKENIVNSVVLSLVGAKNIANYDVLGTFLNASFRTTGQKHRKIQCFCCFAILIFNFCFLACCKNIVNTMVFAVCGLPFFQVVCCCSAPRTRARAFWVSFWVCVRRARARGAQQQQQKKKTSNNNSNNNNNNNNSNNNNNNIINNNININININNNNNNNINININNNNNNININNNNNNINNIINNNNKNQNPPKTSYCHPTRTHTLFPGTAGGCVSSWIYIYIYYTYVCRIWWNLLELHPRDHEDCSRGRSHLPPSARELLPLQLCGQKTQKTIIIQSCEELWSIWNSMRQDWAQNASIAVKSPLPDQW